MNLNEQLRHDREQLDLTVAQVAKKIGLSERCIYTHERKGTTVSDLCLRKYGHAYHHTPSYYLKQAQAEGLYNNMGKNQPLTTESRRNTKHNIQNTKPEPEPELRVNSHLSLANELILIAVTKNIDYDQLIRDFELFCLDVYALLEDGQKASAIECMMTIINACQKLRARLGIRLHKESAM